MRTGPFSKCEHRFGSQIGCQVRTRVVLTESHTENYTENRRWLSVREWEKLNTGCTSPDEGENLPHFAGKKTLVSRGGRFSHRVGATQLVQTLTSDRAGCRLLWHLASPPQPPPDRIYSFWAIFCISQPGKQGFCTVQEVPKR
jgi:hypothetical protein